MLNICTVYLLHFPLQNNFISNTSFSGIFYYAYDFTTKQKNGGKK